MDWIKEGKQLKHFKYPPSILTDEDIQTFGSDLKAVIEEKLSVLNSRNLYITRRNEARIRRIEKLTKSGSLGEWFCLEYTATEYAEHFYIFRWQKYWLGILDKLNPQKMMPYAAQSLDIARAKAFPIEQLYSNQLRKFGGRFNGLCPFHKERTPSFFIFPDNRFYCYGCNENGDSIDFLMKSKGYDFKEAVRSLSGQY